MELYRTRSRAHLAEPGKITMQNNLKLTKDSSGAVMIMAVFVAIFMVAIVYHVAGVGGAALEQQIVQDGADSVAYSTATAKARGMNIIALLNLIMAAVLAVLVALKLLQAVLVVAIAIVGVACIISQGAACGAIRPLNKVRSKLADITDEVEPKIKKILKGLRKAENAVVKVVPILAEGEAVYISTRPEYSPVKIGFAFPVVEKLPTTDGSFDELCEHAGENVVVACTFLLPGDMPSIAQDALGGLVGDLASTFSSFFCGGSDGSKPDSMTQDRAYPINDHNECDDSGGRPDSETGECYSALCEQCAKWGCAKCLSAQDSSDYQKGLWTRRVDEWVEWPRSSGGVGATMEISIKEAVWLEDDPCDGEGICGSIDICSTEEREDAEDNYPEGAKRVRKLTYINLNGCIIEEESTPEMEGEPLNSDDWPKPLKVDDEELPEGLRVRGFVLAGSKSAKRQDRVAVKKNGGGKAVPGRIGFAAADFFSADMDLWHMNWKSRLIRFRKPTNGDGGDSGSGDGAGMTGGCSGAFASECEKVSDKISSSFDSIGADNKGGGFKLEDFILH